MPAKAGIHWVPAFAGTTNLSEEVAELAGLVVADRFVDFFLGVHDEGALGHDGLVVGRAVAEELVPIRA